MAQSYRVLLYYKYVPIDHAEAYAQHHLAFCKALGLRGRILVADEGLNGTVSGTVAQTEAYMRALHMDPRFADMVFKMDDATDHVFQKMHVRYRSEIVRLGLEEDLDPNILTGQHLDPIDFYKALQEDDVIIVDVRNDYEYDLGHFRKAIRPDVKAFRDLVDWTRTHLADQKDKKILTYCTGGIRCEKFTGFLLREGFEDVAQLRGGIVSYGQDPMVQGRLFDGKCYVFDERIAVPVNQTKDAQTIAACAHCGTPCDRYINCANLACHDQFFCCPVCEATHQGYCTTGCTTSSK